VTFHLFCVYIK